jgi:outer membrane protein assembly factor BamC
MAALALALSTLAGCDTLNDWFSSDKVNYKGAGSAPPLAISERPVDREGG